jgi:cytosine/adenosine deaminase-related metal-dependent hydrolase
MWLGPAITFVNGAVIGPDNRIFDSVRVARGRIDALGSAPQRHDRVVDLDQAVLLPGLINAHDHLELNSFARLKWRPRYTNVRQWIADFQPRFASDPALAAATPDTLSDRVWVGALKNLLSGVTTVCHHNPLHRALRWRYPIKVVKRFGLSHSLDIDGTRVAATYRQTPKQWPWIIHAAEGVDEAASGELRLLSELGCLGSNTVLVHGVALQRAGAEQVLQRGGALVWCPTSNDFLFGRTADVRPFSDCDRLALGSDSRLSGAGDLLDELRGAWATQQLSAESLVKAVTSNAANVLRLADAGRLIPGAPADITVIRRQAADPFESVVAASRRDLHLTMVNGVPLVASTALAATFRHKRDAVPVHVDGMVKLMGRQVVQRASALALPEPGLECA